MTRRRSSGNAQFILLRNWRFRYTTFFATQQQLTYGGIVLVSAPRSLFVPAVNRFYLTAESQRDSAEKVSN